MTHVLLFIIFASTALFFSFMVFAMAEGFHNKAYQDKMAAGMVGCLGACVVSLFLLVIQI